MRVGPVQILRERPGVISEAPCWVGIYSCYLYTAPTLSGLLWQMARVWDRDRHVVGY